MCSPIDWALFGVFSPTLLEGPLKSVRFERSCLFVFLTKRGTKGHSTWALSNSPDKAGFSDKPVRAHNLPLSTFTSLW